MKPIPAIARPCAVLAGLLVLAACDKNKFDPPAELTQFDATAKVERIWSASVGGARPKLRLALDVALDGDQVYAAGGNGDVIAYDVNTGRRLWATDTKLKLSGGPGAGGGLVVAGATHGDFIALDAATGAIKWKSHINSEILSAPAVTADFVLLRTVDGRLSAFRSSDGTQLWAVEQSVPRLSLRGAASPAVGGDLVISGFDNGRVMALQAGNGNTLWDVSVAPPSGKSELDRLVDIDSAVKIVDTDIYAVTFQGKVARIDRDTGQVQWSRDLSSYSGLATDEDGVYVSTAAGGVVKIGRRTGVEMWNQLVLTNRRLSPPAVVGSLVVVADLQGYVHFLDAATGNLAARTKVGGERVSAPPVVNGDKVVLVDADGKITALRVVKAGA